MRVIEFLDRLFTHILGAVCVALFLVMLVSIFGQVVMRYGFSSPLSWSEELARYAMVWLAMLASALCLRKGQHLALLSADALPARIGTPVRVIGTLVVTVLLAILLWHSYDLASRAFRQTTPGLGLSMSWIYASLPAGFALMLLGQFLGLATARSQQGGDHETTLHEAG
ncbi:TRAP transporter small permease [Acuticoccus kandeliae]|uniref:TRAP transporter small permease n=1 Tax=Acuticoccus kandeliae TaxID=2073160 RepID=UPI000D3E6BF2|nr:TRAP transporter small permease [Acuticoccus kandeliae]